MQFSYLGVGFTWDNELLTVNIIVHSGIVIINIQFYNLVETIMYKLNTYLELLTECVLFEKPKLHLDLLYPSSTLLLVPS